MKYSIFDKFVLRTPLASLNKLDELLNETSLQGSKNWIGEAYQNPLYQEALFLASPDLYHKLIEYLEGKILSKKELDKLFISLMKYFTRMATRSTPFGLFASCSLGNFGPLTDFKLADNQFDLIKKTRLDMSFIYRLTEILQDQESIKKNLIYHPNSYLYQYNDRLKFVEYLKESYGPRQFIMSSVENSFYLDKLLKISKNGSSYDMLIESLLEENLELDEIKEFVDELIDSQVLCNNLYPTISGEESIIQIIKTLKNIDGNLLIDFRQGKSTVSHLVDYLVKLNDKLNSNSPLPADGNSVKFYNEISSQIEKDLGFDFQSLLQVDLFRTATCITLNDAIKKEINEAIKVLNKLNTERDNNQKLEKFKDAFVKRYASQEISLLQALDIDTGIGYPANQGEVGDFNPLIHGFEYLYQSDSAENNPNVVWNKIQGMLLQKVIESKAKSNNSITIEDDDLNGIEENWEDLPETFSCQANLLSQNDNYLIVLSEVGGSSAVNVLSRFSNLDLELGKYTAEIICEEEKIFQKDSIVAEIVHLPHSRVGNIMQRPILRKYEVPILTYSTLPTSQVLDLTDIYISVVENEIVVKSKALNKRIYFRNSCAHNFTNNTVPVYHFLSDLQFEKKRRSISFNWGMVSTFFQHMPRVIYKNCILSLSRWNLSQNDFNHLLDLEDETLFSEVAKWRTELSIAKQVTINDQDLNLFIDFDNPLSVKIFIHTIRNKNSIVLIEFIQNTNNALTSDQSGKKYFNEMIFGFYKSEHRKENRKTLPPANRPRITIDRNFAPGSEWVYFKIYSGSNISEKFLAEVLSPFVKMLYENLLIDNWFFIRYKDPNHHLRIRLNVNNSQKVGEVISMFFDCCSVYLRANLIWNIQMDTYSREIERYGENTMEISETIFCADSNFILSTICELNRMKNETFRWLTAIKAIDQFLDDLNYSLESKLSLAKGFSEMFQKEFHGGKSLSVSLSDKFRSLRPEMNKLLKNPDAWEPGLDSLIDLISEKSNNLKAIYAELLNMNDNNSLEVTLDELIGSYLHMLVNRIFISKQRLHEMILYSLLYSYYKSELAIEKKADAQKAL